MFDDFRFSLKSAYHSALAETKVNQNYYGRGETVGVQLEG